MAEVAAASFDPSDPAIGDLTVRTTYRFFSVIRTQHIFHACVGRPTVFLRVCESIPLCFCSGGRSGACAEVADALVPCIALLRALCLRWPTIKVGRTQKQLSKRTALGSAASARRL